MARLGELTVVPYMRSQYYRSRLFLDVTRLERATAAGDRRETRRQLRLARRSARLALRTAAPVAARQPEVFRLAGLLHWHSGRRRRALRWWRKSLERARALDARPDLGRTQLEIGRRLRAAGPAALADADAALREARAIFESLGLDRDRALLEALEARAGRGEAGASNDAS
jgi:tetratricopeptide (TPR) repeat protein